MLIQQDNNLFQTNNYRFFEKINVSLAKARALTIVAVSTNFNEYEPTLVSDYFNALLAFWEEISESFAQIEQCLLRPLNQHQCEIPKKSS
jgi:hypothetical protein